MSSFIYPGDTKVKVNSFTTPRYLYFTGSGVSVAEDSSNNRFTITVTGGSGEANTGANVGTGEGNVFRDKTSTTLNLKTIKAGTNITVTDNANDITIAASVPDATITTKGKVELATDGENVANVVVQGNDSRLAQSTTTNRGTVTLAADGGTTESTVVQATDARLSNSRTPTAHVHAGTDITTSTVADARLSSNVPLKDGTNTFTGVNAFDVKTQLKSLASTPTDPTSGYTEIYGKVKDVSNDGIFAKYKIGGAITEVELGVADDVLSLTELSDVTITSPADKHIPIYNGTQFVNRVLAAADMPATVALTDAANTFTAVQKINVDNGQQVTFYRPVNTAGFGAGFYYNFNDSTPAEQTYGFQYIGIEDNTASSHRGDFYIQLAVAASLGIRFRVFTSGNGGFIAGNNQRILISETGLTAQRTITFPDADATMVGTTTTQTITNKTVGTTGLTFAQVAAGSVATPSAGTMTLFLNSADGKLSVKDSSDVVTALY